MSDHTTEIPEITEPHTLGALAGRWTMRAIIIAAIGIVGALLVGVLQPGGLAGTGLRRLAVGYLDGFMFFTTICLGALFFVNVQHLTRAGWSPAVRRLAELLAVNLQTMLLLALPLLALVPIIYPWAVPGATAEMYTSKQVWLSRGYFSIRIIVYFLIWIALARWYWGNSLAQDSSRDPERSSRQQRWAGATMVVFPVTLFLAAFDLVMSLEPHWYSTMFGVYIFAGCVISFYATMILITRRLQKHRILAWSITVEHLHDMGKLMFGFTFFWGYVAFAQYMLLWYGNIPEEQVWLAVRGTSTNPEVPTNGWGCVAVFLLFVHLLIAFPLQLSRQMKRNVCRITFLACWMLMAHFTDWFWITMPEVDSHIGWSLAMSLFCWLAVGGVWAAGLIRLAGQRSLIPLGDPRLGESLAFENY